MWKLNKAQGEGKWEKRWKTKKNCHLALFSRNMKSKLSWSLYNINRLDAIPLPVSVIYILKLMSCALLLLSVSVCVYYWTDLNYQVVSYHSLYLQYLDSTSDLILFYFRVEVTFLSLTSFPTVMFVEILLVSSNNAHDALVVESSSTFIGHCHYHHHFEICHDVVSWL